jgi:DNA-binding NarL/FixJ family response regulator
VNAHATASTGSGATRVLLAIAHGRTRAALRTALESNGEIEVAALVSSSVHLARMAAIEHVDVVVFDLRLAPPGTSPPLADLVASLGGIPLVAVGLDGDPAFARAALQAGASAHVLTDETPERFLDVVGAVRRR